MQGLRRTKAMSATAGRVGRSIICTVCGHTKKPRGRAEPLGTYYCTHDTCEGYNLAPEPGSLWSGESEADFGYCSICGWPFRDGRCTRPCDPYNAFPQLKVTQLTPEKEPKR